MAEGSQLPRPILLGLLLCVLSPMATQGGKLLMIPVDGSHWLTTLGLIQQLQKRGHEIVVVAPDSFLHIKEAPFYTWKKYPVQTGKENMKRILNRLGQKVFENKPLLQRVVESYKDVKENSALFLSLCSSLLYNKELMRSLVASNFDLMLADPFLPCGPIVAQYLALPTVFFSNDMPCSLDSQGTQCPKTPSYVPRSLSMNSDHMTFLERVKNMLIAGSESFLCDVVYSPYAQLASEFLQRTVTVQDLMSNASVWILRSDFVNSYPRPIMPNMVFVGGINCANQKPLSQVCICVCVVGGALLALFLKHWASETDGYQS